MEERKQKYDRHKNKRETKKKEGQQKKVKKKKKKRRGKKKKQDRKTERHHFGREYSLSFNSDMNNKRIPYSRSE